MWRWSGMKIIRGQTQIEPTSRTVGLSQPMAEMAQSGDDWPEKPIAGSEQIEQEERSHDFGSDRAGR